jgi:hypothetical protein
MNDRFNASRDGYHADGRESYYSYHDERDLRNSRDADRQFHRMGHHQGGHLTRYVQRPPSPRRLSPRRVNSTADSQWVPRAMYAGVMKLVENKFERLLAAQPTLVQQPAPPPARSFPIAASSAPTAPTATPSTTAGISVTFEEYAKVYADREIYKAKVEALELANKGRSAKSKERKLRSAEAKRRAITIDSASDTSSMVTPEQAQSPYRDALNAAAAPIQLPNAARDAVLDANRSISAIKAAITKIRPGGVEHLSDVWTACFPAAEMPSSKDKALKEVAEFLLKNIGRLAVAKK